MKLSKREQLLLTILAFALVLVAGYYLLIRPQMSALAAARLNQEQVATQREQMELLLNGNDLDARFSEQQQKAQENYDVFYSKLNSYNIDKILAELVTQHGLTPSRMQIGEYGVMSGSQGEEKPVGQQLLVCPVTLTVSGSTDSILNFLHALNETSFCLKAQALQMETDPTAVGGPVTQATFALEIYGVQMPDLATQE